MSSLLLDVIDHLVFRAPAMEQGCMAVEKLLGVSPAPGGRHPNWGTRNALASLGPRVYLEVMGPDDSAPDPLRPRPFGLDTETTPRLVTWAARASDLERLVEIARSEGVDLGEAQAGSRRKPDGVLLQWKMTDLRTERQSGVIPFFIDWGSTPHPGGSTPQGCTLEELRLFHPDPRRIRRTLRELGIQAEVGEGPARLQAIIQSPLGRVVLE